MYILILHKSKEEGGGKGEIPLGRLKTQTQGPRIYRDSAQGSS
jgi:hypothetical protein